MSDAKTAIGAGNIAVGEPQPVELRHRLAIRERGGGSGVGVWQQLAHILAVTIRTEQCPHKLPRVYIHRRLREERRRGIIAVAVPAQDGLEIGILRVGQKERVAEARFPRDRQSDLREPETIGARVAGDGREGIDKRRGIIGYLTVGAQPVALSVRVVMQQTGQRDAVVHGLARIIGGIVPLDAVEAVVAEIEAPLRDPGRYDAGHIARGDKAGLAIEGDDKGLPVRAVAQRLDGQPPVYGRGFGEKRLVGEKGAAVCGKMGDGDGVACGARS